MTKIRHARETVSRVSLELEVCGARLTIRTLSLVHRLASLTARSPAEEHVASGVIRDLETLVSELDIKPAILGILSQMGQFSKICETTYTFGIAMDPERQAQMKILFSLRNVCPQPRRDTNILCWVVNHITIFHQLSSEEDKPIWFLMEDYDSVLVFLNGEGEDSHRREDMGVANLLNLCKIGWTAALRDIERNIFIMVPVPPNSTRLVEI